MQLAMVMRLNALSCLGFGTLFSIGPKAVAAFLGDAPAFALQLLGLGLVLNGVLLLGASRPRRAPRRREVLFFCAGDVVWVLATVMLVVGDFWITTVSGQIAALAVAAGVGTMGLLQWRDLPAS